MLAGGSGPRAHWFQERPPASTKAPGVVAVYAASPRLQGGLPRGCTCSHRRAASQWRSPAQHCSLSSVKKSAGGARACAHFKRAAPAAFAFVIPSGLFVLFNDEAQSARLPVLRQREPPHVGEVGVVLHPLGFGAAEQEGCSRAGVIQGLAEGKKRANECAPNLGGSPLLGTGSAGREAGGAKQQQLKDFNI